jgi:hypothetical protein
VTVDFEYFDPGIVSCADMDTFLVFTPNGILRYVLYLYWQHGPELNWPGYFYRGVLKSLINAILLVKLDS